VLEPIVQHTKKRGDRLIYHHTLVVSAGTEGEICYY